MKYQLNPLLEDATYLDNIINLVGKARKEKAAELKSYTKNDFNRRVLKSGLKDKLPKEAIKKQISNKTLRKLIKR